MSNTQFYWFDHYISSTFKSGGHQSFLTDHCSKEENRGRQSSRTPKINIQGIETRSADGAIREFPSNSRDCVAQELGPNTVGF